MSDEQSFLAEITANPTDMSLRLVYADWLEEQGDPRAELVRIEVDRGKYSIIEDGYWHRKDRRNELLADCTDEWREAMGYAAGRYQPVFTSIRSMEDPTIAWPMPSDWKIRWRLIREFIERWHGIPMRDVGTVPPEVGEIEERTGLKVGEGVREWIALIRELEHALEYVLPFAPYDGVEFIGDAVSVVRSSIEVDLAIRFSGLPDIDPQIVGLNYIRGTIEFAGISTFITQHLVYNLQYDGVGTLGASIQDYWPFYREFATVEYGDDQLEVFESPGLIGIEESGEMICVAQHGMTIEDVPPYLVKLAAIEQECHGIFDRTNSR